MHALGEKNHGQRQKPLPWGLQMSLASLRDPCCILPWSDNQASVMIGVNCDLVTLSEEVILLNLR